MKIDRSKYDADGTLKNGVLYDVGKFTGNRKTGEWRAYDASGKLIKTTRHKSR